MERFVTIVVNYCCKALHLKHLRRSWLRLCSIFADHFSQHRVLQILILRTWGSLNYFSIFFFISRFYGSYLSVSPLAAFKGAWGNLNCFPIHGFTNNFIHCHPLRNLRTARSSRSQIFFKINVLENFAIFTGKHLRWSLFVIKLQA